MYQDPFFEDVIEDIAVDIVDMVKAKNKDYGNSFELLYNKYGMVALAIRFADKFNRLDSLAINKYQHVKDETIQDTLKDIAGYALLGLYILEKEKVAKGNNPCAEIPVPPPDYREMEGYDEKGVFKADTQRLKEIKAKIMVDNQI